LLSDRLLFKQFGHACNVFGGVLHLLLQAGQVLNGQQCGLLLDEQTALQLVDLLG
jgi:hypothetical protein